jgi:hypothetical protein
MKIIKIFFFIVINLLNNYSASNNFYKLFSNNKKIVFSSPILIMTFSSLHNRYKVFDEKIKIIKNEINNFKSHHPTVCKIIVSSSIVSIPIWLKLLKKNKNDKKKFLLTSSFLLANIAFLNINKEYIKEILNEFKEYCEKKFKITEETINNLHITT